MSLASRLLFVGIATLIYLALAILAYGGFSNLHPHPAVIALLVVFVALCVASAFTTGGNLSAGVREDRGNRWVVAPIMILGLLLAFVPPWSDHHDVWTIGGEATRWIGVVLVAIGGTLRIWPVYVLGNRFSGLVAIQPDHALVTTGPYAFIRHPSYLGLLIGALGWALAFRSGIGVVLALLLVPLDRRAHQLRRGTAARAVRRRVRCLSRANVTHDSQDILRRSSHEPCNFSL